MFVLLTIANVRIRSLCAIPYCKTHVSLPFYTLQESKKKSIYVENRTRRLVKRRSVYVYGVRFCTVLHRTNSICRQLLRVRVYTDTRFRPYDDECNKTVRTELAERN